MKCLVAVLLLVVWVCPAWAEHVDTNREIENLKQRISELEARQQPSESALAGLADHIRLSGLVLLEMNYAKGDGHDDQSDLTLATAQLSVEAIANEFIGGHIVLLYEEDAESPDDDTVKIDEAVISLRCPKSVSGLHPEFEGGRLYLPFGNFASSMISDPLTLELGQTSDTAAVLSLAGEKGALRLAFANGAVDDNDNIDTIAVSLALQPVEWVEFGVSYLSDLAESGDGLVADASLYSSEVAALSSFIRLEFEEFGVGFEIVSALDEFDAMPGLAGDNLTGSQPWAWNCELSWEPNEALQLVARAEGAEDYAADLQRYGATVSYGLFQHTVVAGEYLYSNDADDQEEHALTAQLAFEF